ncbi:MAG: acyl-CoA/acyl-ACP dehydrogenase [Bacillales bacterium]|nr:acyl-CoA/acyl-ACP dehydrogenase [Bacillales bacterium]
MNFARTKEEKDRLEQIGKLAVRFSERAAKIDGMGSFPFENIKNLKESGYTTWTLGKEFGGKGISLYEFLLYQEKMAEGDGSTALAIGWHMGTIMDLSARRPWKIDVWNEVVERVKKGALINTAATEPQTGSPTRGGLPQTTAVFENGQWVINGRKTYTTLSPVLDFILVKAYIPQQKTVGIFLVPKETKGISIEETWNTISMRGTGSHDLLLKDVHLDEKYFVETVDPKNNQSAGWLLHIPACYLGIASAARNYALQFSSEYSPNSIEGTISDLPNIRQLIGQMELDLLQARTFMYAIAEKWDHSESKEELQTALGAVKHVAVNASIRVVDAAMRIAGSKSLFLDNPLQRYYRDVRAGLHNPPMDDAVIAMLAQKALDGIRT